MKRVINFSGGKTSALMTILLKPTDDDIVLFTDTGREHPLTYKFIDDFERNENIKVHRAEYTHTKAPGLKGLMH
jgi:3'-phosphoadenosine 5'-phosphosulfate sulfotransferase (PAPS reductase)/FAD synthetase